ncbi:cytosol aminopeptidase-like [Cimex lectularius]|uniref:Cytosol aminopeptidase n=1 Tax=Cimex lectularius TaxID=79782 RepID=A0A8I6RX18_CIMLE|nr:cytosol aminopeptidase-like [Cimex lectularius]
MYGRAAFNKLLRRRTCQKVYVRAFEEFACDTTTKHKGLVLGAYDGCHVGEYRLTHTAEKFDIEVGGRLSDLLKTSGIKLGECVVYNNLSPEFYAIAVAGLGLEGLGYNEIECIEECKENIRIAAGTACSTLQDNHNITTIMVEEFTNPEAAAEGSSLSIWRYQEQKAIAKRKLEPNLEMYDAPDRESWGRGIIKGESQNYARYLEESPANIMTPSDFARSAINTLCPCGVAVEVRDRPWLEEKNLCTFLNMAKGSSQPPLLLELSYCGGAEDDKPVMLIGKGITFSSGGLCLKDCNHMDQYRADMAGGAVIVGVLKALALLGTPLNVTGLVPLCENMPGGMAAKPGDTIVGRLGKTIKIENTDKEGQVVLSDVLHFSGTHKPCLVITIGTLSGATRHALGSSASAVFSTSDVVWREMARAGAESGDRVWRLPLWKHYYRKITRSPDVDLSNVGHGIGGDPCVAASFLLECAPPVDFLHIDNTGTGMEAGSISPPYLRQGFMTGRPTRTIIQFLQQIACPNDRPSPC